MTVERELEGGRRCRLGLKAPALLTCQLGLNTPLDEKVLHPADFYEVIRYLLKLRKNPALIDDIDHLGNRRVRSVGELLENQFRIGLVRIQQVQATGHRAFDVSRSAHEQNIGHHIVT